MTLPKINKEALKTSALIVVVSVAAGFACGVHYESKQMQAVNTLVQSQLSAVKK